MSLGLNEFYSSDLHKNLPFPRPHIYQRSSFSNSGL